MAASLSFLSLEPQSLSIHQPSSAAAGVFASSLFTPSSLKMLPKLVLSLNSTSNYVNPCSRFVRSIAISYELGSEVDEEDEGFDYSWKQSSPQELKLYVGNLPFNVDSFVLAELFQQAGEVAVAEVIYDRISGQSKHFEFVTMSSIEEVEAAVQQFNGYEIQGRALRVNSGPALPKREKSSPSFRGGPRGGESSSDSSNRVYVGNLAWGVDNHTLETMFAEHGNVKEVTMIFDRESGRSKGFGFVTYCSSDEVNNAIESMDGMDNGGRCLRVSRAEARPPKREY